MARGFPCTTPTRASAIGNYKQRIGSTCWVDMRALPVFMLRIMDAIYGDGVERSISRSDGMQDGMHYVISKTKGLRISP